MISAPELYSISKLGWQDVTLTFTQDWKLFSLRQSDIYFDKKKTCICEYKHRRDLHSVFI